MKSQKQINYGLISGLVFILISVILFFFAKDVSVTFFIIGILILFFSKNENKIELRKDINKQKE